jgi:DUF971 family protein
MAYPTLYALKGNMHPTSLTHIGNELVVLWDDGHEAYYSGETLRRKCPCAYCAGEPDLFGRLSKPAPRPLSERAFEVRNAEAVGNYGVQVTFEDGHSYGIWTFPRLREACECDACRNPETAPVMK